MSEQNRGLALTPLDHSYERVRRLQPIGQLRDCIDNLENPEIIVADVLESVDAIERGLAGDALDQNVLKRRSASRIAAKATESEWFYEGRDLSVLGDSCSFTCLSSDVEPIPADGEFKKGEVDGLDFVGITCNALARPVLGVVQSEADASAYPLLLRALIGLVEMAPAIQFERMNHQYFRGALPHAPKFDLFLVTWYYDETAERTPICEFTRDLAGVLKRAIAKQSVLAHSLNDIVCLRMNPARFDARMRFDWRV